MMHLQCMRRALQVLDVPAHSFGYMIGYTAWHR